jgi:hypothetical protein
MIALAINIGLWAIIAAWVVRVFVSARRRGSS